MPPVWSVSGLQTKVFVTLAVAGPGLAGLLLLLLAPSPSGAFSWFAYAPLSGGGSDGFVILTNWQHVLGAVLLAVGVLAGAVFVGYRVGRSRPASD